MTGSGAYELLSDIRDYFSVFPAKIILNENMQIREDTTDFDHYNKIVCNIGVKEFVDNPNKEFSNDEVIISVAGMFHEVCGHGIQCLWEFNKDTALSNVLALNYSACRGFSYYYGFREHTKVVDGKVIRYMTVVPQYFRQPHEIAAQYAGIKACNDFLSWRYNPQQAEKLIRSYVQHRVKNHSEFIASVGSTDSVPDILCKFDKAFQDRVFVHRNYGIGLRKGDCVGLSGTWWYGLAVAACFDGLKQDAMVASLYISSEHAIVTFIHPL